jgi:peroxiredoxin Q/BCP
MAMKATSLSLVDQQGTKRSLSEFRGKWVVVYFYPKDFTSGCTKQACAFRDAQAELDELEAVVIGISKDSPESHGKFAVKHDLGFILLADPNQETAKAWGAFGTKNMYGKKVEGVKRSTFLVAPDGTIEKAWLGVKVDGHVQSVVEALRAAKQK